MIEYNSRGEVDGKASAPFLRALIEKYPEKYYAEIGAMVGLTKNQVIGIVNRNIKPLWQQEELERMRNKEHSHKQKPRKKRVKHDNAQMAKTDYRVNGCQYITGDILTDEHKCGEKTLTGKSYCKKHYDLCYRVVNYGA